MLRQALLGLAVVSLCAAGPAYGQEVKLQLKFKEGQKLWFEEVATVKQTITFMGQSQKADSKTTTVTSYTVQKVTPEGVVLAMKIEDVDTKVEGGLGGAIDQVAGKTKGATLTVTMSPNGKVSKVEGAKEFIQKLVGDDETAKMMKEFINEETLTKGVESTFGFLPDKAVKPGDSWTRETKLPLGGLGDFKLTNLYSYAGKKAGGEAIDDKMKMDFAPPKGGGGFGGLFKVVRGDLKGDGKSTYLFDAQKGRLNTATTTLRMTGSLTMNVGGMESQIGLDMDNTSTTQFHDKDPLKK